tara:strand:- start:318 stop:752 length:435 start_codon:yes stop_codon:yes gene_type:complete
MNLQSLLETKLEIDLVKELNDIYRDDSLQSIIKEKVQKKIKKNPVSIDKNKKVVIKDNQCCARSMGPRYSDIRCPTTTYHNTDYCKTHLKRIEEHGYLRFGRYDGERPIINELGNKIPWRDTSAMEDIDTIIQYQNMNLLKLIK